MTSRSPGTGSRRSALLFQGALVTLAPLLPPLVLLSQGARPWATAPFALGGALLAAGATALGGGLMTSRRRTGRALCSAGFLGATAVAHPLWTSSPLTALSLGVLLWLALGSLWGLGVMIPSPLVPGDDEQRWAARAEGSAAALLASWVALIALRLPVEALTGASLSASLLALTIISAWWTTKVGAHRGRRWAVLAIVTLLGAAGVALSLRGPLEALPLATIPPLVLLALTGAARQWAQSFTEVIELVISSPSQLVVITFFSLCTLGTGLLALPWSAATGQSVGLLDATFTAVSAVCVTGLAILDTAHDFSAFGQAIILLLIQVGGLGIMTLSTAALAAMGRRLSLRAEGVAAELLSGQNRGELVATLRRILLVTFAAELLGAVTLTGAFLAHGDALAAALWRGLFTAVSAFCNAGFALQTDSLVPYQSSHLVLHVVAALIILGGVSPATVFIVPALLSRRHIALQHRLVLIVTAILLVGGAVGFAAAEWSSSLEGLTVAEKLTNAWFQSVTTRTAGFNSVDLTKLQPATLTMFLVLMFIGGSPGGTAGGVKTTTVAVLILAVIGALRGQWRAAFAGRRLRHVTAYRAAAVATIMALLVVLSIIAIQLTQTMAPEVAQFEVISALGTVGLSVGGTAALDRVGQVIIILCMFAGRVGPLTLFLFLSGQSPRRSWDLPEEDVDVG